MAPTEENSGAERFQIGLPSPRDGAWAIAFKVNVAITITAALWFGRTGIKALSSPEMLFGRRLLEDASDSGGAWLLTFFSGVALVALAWAFSWGLLVMLINCSTKILQVAFHGSCAMWTVATVMALTSGQFMLALLFCAPIALATMFYSRHQMRIQFGGEKLKVAALAIKSTPWTIRSALLMSAFQVLWATVISVAAAGSVATFETAGVPDGTGVYRAVDCHNVMHQDATSLSCVCRGVVVSDNSGCSYGGRSATLILFWIVTLLWTGEVVRNVVAATVTGSVASWWYTPHDPNPVLGAFYRATGPSLGSLCKASAITGIARLLCFITRGSFRLKRLFDFLRAFLQIAMDYAVAYTICFIGIYGLSFAEAGSRVGELFRSRGVTTIANDNVVDFGLSLLTLASTMVYIMGVFVLYAASSFASNLFPWVTGGLARIIAPSLYGFVVCAIVISTTLEVVRSGFKAVFVCFVQDPDVLATTHPRQLHADLSKAWQTIQQERSQEAYISLQEVELA